MAKDNKFFVGDELWILDNDNRVRRYTVVEIETRSGGGDVESYYYHLEDGAGGRIRREESLCFKSSDQLLEHVKEMINIVKNL